MTLVAIAATIKETGIAIYNPNEYSKYDNVRIIGF